MPTPTIGMVGLLENINKIITQGFKDDGDLVAVIGPQDVTLAASEFAYSVLDISTEEMIADGRFRLSIWKSSSMFRMRVFEWRMKCSQFCA